VLVEGTIFGDTSKTCYLPIFDHSLTGEQDKKTVIIGNNLLQGYYVVYDMSPLEAGKDYLQVGVSRPADDNYGVQKQYDKISD